MGHLSCVDIAVSRVVRSADSTELNRLRNGPSVEGMSTDQRDSPCLRMLQDIIHTTPTR